MGKSAITFVLLRNLMFYKWYTKNIGLWENRGWSRLLNKFLTITLLRIIVDTLGNKLGRQVGSLVWLAAAAGDINNIHSKDEMLACGRQ